MDQKEKEFEFSLDDILKEFGSASREPELPVEEPAPVEAPQAESDDQLDALVQEFRAAPVPEEPAAEPTVRFAPIEVEPAPVSADTTIRLDPKAVAAQLAKEQPSVTGDTVRFEPIGQESAEDYGKIDPVPIPENAEPFSAGWEPQYEQPMGEYVPPEPIVFRPRSRLHELKRKLVAGPERRYYALAEEGLGKLQISIFLSVLVVILSVVSIGLYRMGLVQENRMRLLVFGELFAMVFSALLGSGRLLDGFAAIFKGKFTLDTLLTLTFLVCIADGVFCLQEVRVPFCAAFCLEMTMSLWAEYERKNTEMGQMDTLRKAIRLNRVAKAPDCFEGRPGFYVTQGEVEDFMEVYNRPSAPEKVMGVYALLAFLASGAIGLLAGLRGGVSAGLQTFSAAILAATPATIFVCQSRPMAVLERRLHRLGTVLCGWQGVKAMSGAAAIPLSDTDLFPAGSMKINGMKFYSGRDTDQTVAYTTALICAGGSGLAALFNQLLDSRNGQHYQVTAFRSYEKGGLGGEVNGESVLVGTLSFLQEMGVELPEGARVNQAVYAAVDGELCGVFALAFGKLKGVSAGLATLCGYRGLTPVLSCDNFLLSEGFIRGKFGVNTRRFAFPTLQERAALAGWNPDPEQSIACALSTQEGLAHTAFAITGARALRTCTWLGTVVHLIGGVVGLLIILALTFVQSAELLTPMNLLLFELIWAVPGLLITEWTRHL